MCGKQYQDMYLHLLTFCIRKEKMPKENLPWTEHNGAAKINCSLESI